MVLVLAVTPDKKLDKRIRDALGTEGWWVSQVDDRQSALRSAADHEPHLVLVDEDVDGVDELVRVFGSSSGGPGAVVLSEDKKNARRSPGVDAILEKAAENGKLLASVKRVMSQPHSPISAAEIQSGEILTARDIFADVLREVADEVAAPFAVEEGAAPAAEPDPPEEIETSGSGRETEPVTEDLEVVAVEAEEPADETPEEMPAVETPETPETPEDAPVLEAAAEIPEVMELPADQPLTEAAEERPAEEPGAEALLAEEPEAEMTVDMTGEPASEEPVAEAVEESPVESETVEPVEETPVTEAAERPPFEEANLESVEETVAETLLESAPAPLEQAVEVEDVEPDPELDQAGSLEVAPEPAEELEIAEELKAEAKSWFESDVVDPPEVPGFPLETVEVPLEQLTAADGRDGDSLGRPVWPTDEDVAPDLPPPPLAEEELLAVELEPTSEVGERVEIPEPVEVAEPEELVDVAEPEEVVEVAESEEQVRATEPEGSVGAPEPEEPAEAAEPEEPAGAAEPEETVGAVELVEPVPAIPEALPEPMPPRSMRLPEPTEALEPSTDRAPVALELGDGDGEDREPSDPTPVSDAGGEVGPDESGQPADGGVGWKRFWLGVAAGLLVFAATSFLLRLTFGGDEPWWGGTESVEQEVGEGAVSASGQATSELEELVAEELARREAELRDALVEEERRLQQRLDEVEAENRPSG